jgi:thiol:disulfide interchange protein DsbC
MKTGKMLLAALMMTTVGFAQNKQDTEVNTAEFAKLKPLDSKAFKILGAKKVGNHYLVTADMTFQGQHRVIDLFVTGDKKMVVFGNGFDTATGKELRSKIRTRYEEGQREAFMKQHKKKNYVYYPAPLEKLAPVTIGSGKDHYYLFTDFDCPFCQALEKRLGHLKENVTLFVLPYPLERLHPHSKAKALAFMEMPKKKRESLIAEHKLSSIKTSGFKPKLETIRLLKKIKAEGDKAHLTGTPYLIDESGQKVKSFDEILEKG